MAKRENEATQVSEGPEAGFFGSIPDFPIWLFLRVSGLYRWQGRLPGPVFPPLPRPDLPPRPLPQPEPPGPLPGPRPGPDPFPFAEEESEAAELGGFPLWPFRQEELRLDVDGPYPQMTASGVASRGLRGRVHWIARLWPQARDRWIGRIWYKDGAVQTFPHSLVRIEAQRSVFPSQRRVTATFFGGGAPAQTRTYDFESPYFRDVEFEVDAVEGTQAVVSYPTGSHPNRPASLPVEDLSLERVYERAGFDARTVAGGSVKLADAGQNGLWSDAEMHDAMQTYWSRFADKPQWALWVLFASLHDQGTSLGGIMFDDIGANHRQGTAIFNDSFIKNPPPNDPAPDAWRRRMRFWTAAHEMGHAFNLAHSWQKALGSPWIPLANESEARSFMNYPFRVQGGQGAFFADFGFRFSDNELLFLRHAPARFVQMGNADWFDDHGFEQAETNPQPRFRLHARVNREKAEYEFLEPVVLELKLENVSGEPQAVDASLLERAEDLTVVIKHEHKPARQWVPYARRCLQPDPDVLQPGRSFYESLFVSAGRNGWDLADPGSYRIQVALHLDGEDVVSEPFGLRVAPPGGYHEERIAQDLLRDDVGRVLAFDGSRALEDAMGALRRTQEELGDRRVAIHAAVALGETEARRHKSIDFGGRSARVEAEDADAARALLDDRLYKGADVAAETLGHIDCRYYTERYADALARAGRGEHAVKVLKHLADTFKARGVLDDVVRDVAGHANRLGRAK